MPQLHEPVFWCWLPKVYAGLAAFLKTLDEKVAVKPCVARMTAIFPPCA